MAWLLIPAGLWALYTAATLGSNEALLRIIEDAGRGVHFQQFIMVLNGIVSFVGAYGIFKGQPWGRVSLMIWQFITLALSLLPPVMMGIVIFNVIATAVVAFFLYRQPANRWFDAKWFELVRRGA